MKDKYFIIIIILGIITSCKEVNTNKSKTSNTNMVKVDSFKVDLPTAILADVKDNKLLIYNMISNEIGVYNITSKNLKRFNKYGPGNDEFMYGLFPNTLKFVGDSLIGVTGIKTIKLYNYEGKFVKLIDVVNEDTYAQLSDIKVIGDSLLIAIRKPQGNNSTIDFYEQEHKLLLKQNINTNTQTAFGDFPLERSDFNNKDFYYPYPFSYYVCLDENNNYSFVNSNDSRLYTFNPFTMQLIKNEKLDLDHYNRLQKPFKVNPTGQTQTESTLEFYTNSIIIGYYKSKDYDFIVYLSAKEKNEVIEEIKNSLDDPNGVQLPLDIWIHTIENGIKKGDDFSISPDLGVPLHFFSPNRVLLGTPANEEDDLNGVSTFYIYDLNR